MNRNANSNIKVFLLFYISFSWLVNGCISSTVKWCGPIKSSQDEYRIQLPQAPVALSSANILLRSRYLGEPFLIWQETTETAITWTQEETFGDRLLYFTRLQNATGKPTGTIWIGPWYDTQCRGWSQLVKSKESYYLVACNHLIRLDVDGDKTVIAKMLVLSEPTKRIVKERAIIKSKVNWLSGASRQGRWGRDSTLPRIFPHDNGVILAQLREIENNSSNKQYGNYELCLTQVARSLEFNETKCTGLHFNWGLMKKRGQEFILEAVRPGMDFRAHLSIQGVILSIKKDIDIFQSEIFGPETNNEKNKSPRIKRRRQCLELDLPDSHKNLRPTQAICLDSNWGHDDYDIVALPSGGAVAAVLEANGRIKQLRLSLLDEEARPVSQLARHKDFDGLESLKLERLDDRLVVVACGEAGVRIVIVRTDGFVLEDRWISKQKANRIQAAHFGDQLEFCWPGLEPGCVMVSSTGITETIEIPFREDLYDIIPAVDGYHPVLLTSIRKERTGFLDLRGEVRSNDSSFRLIAEIDAPLLATTQAGRTLVIAKGNPPELPETEFFFLRELHDLKLRQPHELNDESYIVVNPWESQLTITDDGFAVWELFKTHLNEFPEHHGLRTVFARKDTKTVIKALTPIFQWSSGLRISIGSNQKVWAMWQKDRELLVGLLHPDNVKGEKLCLNVSGRQRWNRIRNKIKRKTKELHIIMPSNRKIIEAPLQ
jgi:hypothetical protein